MLTATSFVDTHKRQSMWLCICECGGTITTTIGRLRGGQARSCGCVPSGAQPIDPQERAFHHDWGKYQASAKIRGINWDLDEETFRKLVVGDCHYCGVEPRRSAKPHPSQQPALRNGIDRVHPERGYRADNCVTCCATCNVAKNDMSVDEYVEWMERKIQHWRTNSPLKDYRTT